MTEADRRSRIAKGRKPARRRGGKGKPDWNKVREAIPPMMGAKEVAAELGVQVSNLDKVRGLPPEIPQDPPLAGGRRWVRDEVLAFARDRERRQADK